MANPEEIDYIAECTRVVVSFFGPDVQKAEAWFVTKNSNFGGSTPIELLAEGKGRKLLAFVRAAAAVKPKL